MKPKKVTLDSAELEDVDSVEIRVLKPASDHGLPSGRTTAVQIVLTRVATRVPSAVGFDLATNKDGKTKYITGHIELQDDEKKTTYTLTIKDAYVEQWRLVSPAQQKKNDPKVKEVWVVRAGDVSLNASGVDAPFKLATFGKASTAAT